MKKQYEELTEEEYLNQSLRQNKPNIVFPIISSLFAVALLIATISLYINQEIEKGFLIFGVIILILMPVCSWYTNYFAKKYNQKKIYNFQDETEMLVKFTSRLKGYRAFDITEENYPTYKIEYVDELKLGSVTYDKDKCLLNNGTLTGTLITFGISFAGLIVNSKTKKVENVSGMLPRSVWMKSKLNVPTAKKGIITVEHEKISTFTILKSLKDDNTYYDKKSGWVCIGNKKAKNNNYAVQFMDNAIIVFNELNQVESLWLNLGLNLEVN